MITEQQNPRSGNIDELSTIDALQLMNDEDAQVAQAVRSAIPQIATAVDGIAERLQNGGRLIYIGAGTSGRLGVLDAVECVPTFSTPPELVVGLIAGGERAFVRAVEGAEDRPELGVQDLQGVHLAAGDCVVGIAASGRTPYVLGAMAEAKRVGSFTVGIACNVPSPLLQAVEVAIGVQVGPEVITGSTRLKAGTAQKLVLNMLSTMVMVRLGKVYGNLMVDVQVTNQKLEDRARRIVAQVAGVSVDEAARALKASGNAVKVSIVMARRGVSSDEARTLLDSARGRLREVIGD